MGFNFGGGLPSDANQQYAPKFDMGRLTKGVPVATPVKAAATPSVSASQMATPSAPAFDSIQSMQQVPAFKSALQGLQGDLLPGVSASTGWDSAPNALPWVDSAGTASNEWNPTVGLANPGVQNITHPLIGMENTEVLKGLGGITSTSQATAQADSDYVGYNHGAKPYEFTNTYANSYKESNTNWM
ncbi:MAG: hypothetical protein DRN30_04125 [Thermoplasmata archaeon]|nr:MAG: hypothetical protein DRN30_04125 [Thermoplasmata archaeon]